MQLKLENILKPAFVARHYRGIVFGIVMINTALIVFLIVYIWSYGVGGVEETRSFRQGQGESARRGGAVGASQHVALATVAADNLVAWSRPGGSAGGGVSRGVLARGETLPVLGSMELEGGRWLKVGLKGREGWVPADGVRYIREPR